MAEKNELNVATTSKNGTNPMHKILTLIQRGVANFNFIFLNYFSINFEYFAVHLLAFMLKFPKHSNFFNF